MPLGKVFQKDTIGSTQLPKHSCLVLPEILHSPVDLHHEQVVECLMFTVFE